jgi:hypothetical protein
MFSNFLIIDGILTADLQREDAFENILVTFKQSAMKHHDHFLFVLIRAEDSKLYVLFFVSVIDVNM